MLSSSIVPDPLFGKGLSDNLVASLVGFALGYNATLVEPYRSAYQVRNAVNSMGRANR
jgi:hypothetical protein